MLTKYPAGAAGIRKTLELQKEAYGQAIPERGTLAKIFGLSPLSAQSVSWYQGVTGEKQTGSWLASLGEDFLVLHAVPVGSGESDIDHLVIGPAGMFTINSKYHPNSKVWVSEKTVMVNGQRQPYLRNSKFEAQRASKLLSAASGVELHAQGVLAIIAQQLTVKSTPQGVTVEDPKGLVRRIRKAPVVLSDEQLSRLKAAAVIPTTWHTNPAIVDAETLTADFTALQKAVNGSKLVKVLWLLASAPVALYLLWQAVMVGVGILFQPALG